jgi:hypothetical protein
LGNNEVSITNAHFVPPLTPSPPAFEGFADLIALNLNAGTNFETIWTFLVINPENMHGIAWQGPTNNSLLSPPVIEKKRSVTVNDVFELEYQLTFFTSKPAKETDFKITLGDQ